MRQIIRSTGIILAILLTLTLVISFWASPTQKSTEIAISELVQKINAGQIKSISVHGDDLKIIATDDQAFDSKKESGVSIFETLKNAGVQEDKLTAVKTDVKEPSVWVGFLGDFLTLAIPLGLAGLLFWYMLRSAQRGSMQAFSFGKSRAKLAGLNPNDKKITFRDVAGLIEAKEEVSEVVEFLRDPKKFQKLGARIPRGILLVGSPGTGKTLLAKAVANEANVPFFYVSGSEFVEMFVGVGANRVRDTFETAKHASPSIIFVDEIDAVGRQRGTGIGGGHDEREQTLNQILVEMDGFDTNDAVIVMAATNRPDILDPALLRPGRFDRRVILDEPSLKDRVEVLKIHAIDKPMADDIDMRVVAERTPGFSGADLANLVNEAAILAARHNQKFITQADMLESIEKILLGPERRSHVLSPREKEITAYHEAGHALIAANTPHSDPVHKVSIVSRGRAGGYTLKLPGADKYLKTRSEFEDELAVLLGGYMSEKTVFNELTTGASNDLKVASDLARKMVTQFGMSDKLGPLTYGDDQEAAVFLGREMIHERNYSESIAQEIDHEVRSVIEQAEKKAREILVGNMDKLQAIAKELIAKETLEQAEFYALIGKPLPAKQDL